MTSYSYAAYLHDTMESALDNLAADWTAETPEALDAMTDAELADEWESAYGDEGMHMPIVGQRDEHGEQMRERFTREDLIAAFARLRSMND